MWGKKLKMVSEGVGDMGVRRLTHFVDGNQDHIRHLGDVLGDRLGRRLRLLLQGQKPQVSSRAQFWKIWWRLVCSVPHVVVASGCFGVTWQLRHSTALPTNTPGLVLTVRGWHL